MRYRPPGSFLSGLRSEEVVEAIRKLKRNGGSRSAVDSKVLSGSEAVCPPPPPEARGSDTFHLQPVFGGLFAIGNLHTQKNRGVLSGGSIRESQ